MIAPLCHALDYESNVQYGLAIATKFLCVYVQYAWMSLVCMASIFVPEVELGEQRVTASLW